MWLWYVAELLCFVVFIIIRRLIANRIPRSQRVTIRLADEVHASRWELERAIDVSELSQFRFCSGYLHGFAVRRPAYGIFPYLLGVGHWGVLQHYIALTGDGREERHYLSVYHVTTYSNHVVHQPVTVFVGRLLEETEAMRCMCYTHAPHCPLHMGSIHSHITRSGETAVEFARELCGKRSRVFGANVHKCRQFGYWVLTGTFMPPRTAPLWASLLGLVTAAWVYAARLWRGHIHWIAVECMSYAYVLLLVWVLTQIARASGQFPVALRAFIAVLIIYSLLPTEAARVLLLRLLG